MAPAAIRFGLHTDWGVLFCNVCYSNGRREQPEYVDARLLRLLSILRRLIVD